MSQKMISQKVQRTCDGCGVVTEYELINASAADEESLQNWYTVIREVAVDGQWVKIMVQTCSLACIPAGAIKLALPTRKEPTEDEKIDLASLQVGGATN